MNCMTYDITTATKLPQVRDGVVKGGAIPLTQERLKQVLEYDPATGFFRRFGKKGLLRGVAGTLDVSNGYVKIMVDHVIYRAHRLAFLYMEGVFPPNDVDHRNRKKSDNRWSNLRHATPSQNAANKPLPKRTVFLKADIDDSQGCYSTSITVMGECFSLGSFNTIEEARAAHYAAARLMYGDFALVA